jgi:cold shock CspA family protein
MRSQTPTSPGRRTGRVKWFSENRGQGHLIDDDDVERFFNVAAVRGYELPRRGMTVEFRPSSNARGPTASDVVLISPAPEPSARDDGRVECHHCKSRVVPRLVVYRGVAQRSLCTRCGSEIMNFTMSHAIAMWLGLIVGQAVAKLRALLRRLGKVLTGG